MTGRVVVVRGDAARLPLPDESVDLIVTSPPYFLLRSYVDGGKPYPGQIGAEATPREYLDALLACTREWARVLKPEGSLWVNLDDKYAGGGQGGNVGGRLEGGEYLNRTTGMARRVPEGFRAKSLLNLPHRYAIGCTDQLGLIERATVIWRKNGLPESVRDRVQREHEYLFHFTKRERYYSACDEIRRPPAAPGRKGGTTAFGARNVSHDRTATGAYDGQNPLGRVPGSVWDVPTEPLNVPGWVAHARCCGGRKRPGCEDGLNHYAAWPTGLVRPVILGWSPAGICAGCGEGRRPVTTSVRMLDGVPREDLPAWSAPSAPRRTSDGVGHGRFTTDRRLAGYACGCPDLCAPTRPAVVLDPCGGTGATALTASVLGRTGISVDLSHDYGRLAQWRTTDPGEIARALGVPRPPAQVKDQASLFDLEGEAS